uniref:hypothetical protein n=1 Tax=Candidatus Electronema sp. TaxID=2698783 RepID=UPI00405611B3
MKSGRVGFQEGLTAEGFTLIVERGDCQDFAAPAEKISGPPLFFPVYFCRAAW